MSTMRVAKRYAMALIETAQELKALDAVALDMHILADVAGQSREFRVFLRSPVIAVDKKRRVMDEMFGRRLNATTLTFLHLLIRKGRENTLPDIITQFFSLRDEQLGIINVDVKTVVPFSGTQEKTIVGQLENYTGKKVRVTFSLDTSIRGGFVARAGDTVFDGSIRRQLELLREHFTQGAVERN